MTRNVACSQRKRIVYSLCTMFTMTPGESTLVRYAVNRAFTAMSQASKVTSLYESSITLAQKCRAT